MRAMLKEIGIPSNYTTISTINRRLQKDYASVGQMNHVILQVPLKNDTLWLECTNPQLPMGYVHEDIAGHDAIEVSWDVVETSVEDVYDIVTTVKYETQVPVPVVTVSMPQNIEVHKLDEGESLVFHAVITNKGLISAKDVQFSMPEGFREVKFEPLDMEEPFELAPQQSVVMPIKVTRLPRGASNSSRRRVHKPLSEDDCYAFLFSLVLYHLD